MWKDIDGFDGAYQINENGEVYSHKTHKILKNVIGTHGYYLIYLTAQGGKTVVKQIHRLLALAFIPNPENKPCIDHIDGNRKNNSLSNLRWCTVKENNNNPVFKERCSKSKLGTKLSKEAIRKRYETWVRNGRHVNRSLNNGKSKRVVQYDLNMNQVNIFPSLMEVFRHFGYNPSNVGNCCNGKKKTAYGYIWKYVK